MNRKPSFFNAFISFLIGTGVIVAYFIIQIVFFGACMIAAAIHESGASADKSEMNRLVQERYYSTVSVWYFACALFVTAIILTVLLLLRKYGKSNLFGEFWRPGISVRSVSALAVCALSGMALNIGLSSLMSLIPIPVKWIEANDESVNSLLKGNTVIVVLSVVIMPPIVEELIFRGVFHNLLRRTVPLPEYGAIAVSGIIVSVAFGVFHGNMLQGLYTFFLSLILIYVFEVTGDLLACIFFHIGFNGSAVLVYILGAFYNPDAPVVNSVVFLTVSFGLTASVFFLGKKKSERIGTP